MSLDTLNLEIEVLSAEEAAAIWKRQTKRPPNFAQYLTFLNSRNVGDSFRVKVPAGPENEENAREIRRNFGEAAKERIAFPIVDAGTEGAFQGEDGKLHAEQKAPVILRWKTISHKEQREVVNDKGKKGTVEVTVYDALEALLVASDAVVKRAPRTPKEVVEVNNPPADAKKGATIALADGRTATLGANGKWTAPKLDTTNTPSSVDTANGTATNGVAGTETHTPALAGAAA